LRIAFSGVPKFDRYPSTGEVSWLKSVIRAARGPTSATRAATRLGRRAAAETQTCKKSASRKAHPPAANGSAPPASKPSRYRKLSQARRSTPPCGRLVSTLQPCGCGSSATHRLRLAFSQSSGSGAVISAKHLPQAALLQNGRIRQQRIWLKATVGSVADKPTLAGLLTSVGP
jgi:hypothetical protein